MCYARVAACTTMCVAPVLARQEGSLGSTSPPPPGLLWDGAAPAGGGCVPACSLCKPACWPCMQCAHIASLRKGRPRRTSSLLTLQCSVLANCSAGVCVQVDLLCVCVQPMTTTACRQMRCMHLEAGLPTRSLIRSHARRWPCRARSSLSTGERLSEAGWVCLGGGRDGGGGALGAPGAR